ncbi:MAG TPA: insulinase family protein, partial [Polyangiales bacterium]|nr:insulinase family protein [Polyangiales bacterium]
MSKTALTLLLALGLGIGFASAQAPAAPTAPAAPKNPAPAPATATAPAAPGSSKLALTVVRKTLDNGLRIVMNPDHTAPTVAVAVYYDVGSRNELRGHSGFAHLFEHMMFQGSQNVGKGEHFQRILNRGGSANGTTS